MALYTRQGDDGKTRLLGAGPVRKSDVRVEAYGEIDELNAFVGWALTSIEDAEIAEGLRRIQSDLLAIGARLADPGGKSRALESEKVRIDSDRVRELEQWIDRAERETGAVKTFLLPGGCPAGAALHVLRCVSRRAERRVVELSTREPVPADLLRYLNRLSDLFFALARLANHRAGVPDVPW